MYNQYKGQYTDPTNPLVPKSLTDVQNQHKYYIPPPDFRPPLEKLVPVNHR
jgi:hypothetical protein